MINGRVLQFPGVSQDNGTMDGVQNISMNTETDRMREKCMLVRNVVV